MELSRTTGIHAFEKFLLGDGVLSALFANDSAAAEKLMEKMGLPSSSLKPWDACFYHHLKTHEALFREDLKEASLHADLALKFCDDTGVLFSKVLCQLGKAHVLHALGKGREAAEDLTETLKLARQIKSKKWEYFALMAEALFALDRGEEASCLAILRRTLAMGREEEYLVTFIDQPSAMARLCEKALEAGIEVEYVQELIRRRNLTTEKPPLHLENWPWPIKIYTLGRFELIKDGKPIRFSRKAQQKPLSLHKVLIALGGREVREDQIEDALWPEADGDSAHHSFEMTLHRLRKLICDEKAIQYREGRVTLYPEYSWVDVWAFEGITGRVDSKQREGMTETAVLLTQKAIEMYGGPFLAGEVEQSWMISIRERVRRKFLRNVSWLGHYWEESQRWERALECYERGLEVDEPAEELYRRLIMCYQRLDRKAEALSVYNCCKKTLSSALGIEPSPETQALYQKILTENR